MSVKTYSAVSFVELDSPDIDGLSARGLVRAVLAADLALPVIVRLKGQDTFAVYVDWPRPGSAPACDHDTARSVCEFCAYTVTFTTVSPLPGFYVNNMARHPIRPGCPHGCEAGYIVTEGPAPNQSEGHPCPHCLPGEAKQVQIVRDLNAVVRDLRQRLAEATAPRPVEVPRMDEPTLIPIPRAAQDQVRAVLLDILGRAGVTLDDSLRGLEAFDTGQSMAASIRIAKGLPPTPSPPTGDPNPSGPRC